MSDSGRDPGWFGSDSRFVISSLRPESFTCQHLGALVCLLPRSCGKYTTHVASSLKEYIFSNQAILKLDQEISQDVAAHQLWYIDNAIRSVPLMSTVILSPHICLIYIYIWIIVQHVLNNPLYIYIWYWYTFMYDISHPPDRHIKGINIMAKRCTDKVNILPEIRYSHSQGTQGLNNITAQTLNLHLNTIPVCRLLRRVWIKQSLISLSSKTYYKI